MKQIHLDTDLGGDIDDICALAMLLKMEDVSLSGITVVGDTEGKRTGYVKEVLRIVRKDSIPVKMGAENSLDYYRYDLAIPDERKYWPQPVPASVNPIDESLELLKENIDSGAKVFCIGPLTNLYLLEKKYPGILENADIVIMGGHVYPIREGYPKWKNKDDFNVQIDARSAQYVLERCTPKLIPITVTAETYIRRSRIPRIEKSGELGELLAIQMRAFEEDEKIGKRFGEVCSKLPDDMVNFMHDPLACAIALGWRDSVKIKQIPLVIEEKDGFVIERQDKSGRLFSVVTSIDAKKFEEYWVDSIVK